MRHLLLSLAALFLLSAPSASAKPLKVFILCGQSNMQGHAHVRTLPYVGMDPATAPLLKAIQGADGKPKVCKDVWISYLSRNGETKGQLTTGFGANKTKIGPELTFGIYMQRRLKQPILIIKTAWGGKSINTDFRPPSAGPYKFNQSQLDRFKKQNKDLKEIQTKKAAATGRYYKMTVNHVKHVLSDIKRVYPGYDNNQGYELAGFVWFQGWNDMVDRGTYPTRNQKGGYDAYSKVLADFIRDVRKDLKAPKLPFVIGVMGVGGPVKDYTKGRKRYAKIHQNFRDAMAAPAKLAEFKGNVSAVLTEKYWDQGLVTLREKDGQLRRQIRKLKKEKDLNRKQERQALEALRKKTFSAKERKVMRIGASNAPYHYLGSAKIMAQIGQGFAEAIPLK